MVLLSLKSVSKSFGGVKAVDSVSIEVKESKITGIVGPNGSGKSTLLNIISGHLRPDGGRISYGTEDIQGKKPHEMAALGIGRTFQITKVFSRLSVRDNVTVALLQGMQGSEHLDKQVIAQRASKALAFFELTNVESLDASNLSYGQQKLTEFARVLVRNPSLILLDEPFAGINPVLKQKIFLKIKELNEDGMTILIVEHDMQLVKKLCHELVVMDGGRKIAEGLPDDVITDPRVRSAYLGAAM